MDLSDSQLKLIISKLFKGTITPEEQRLLDCWLNARMERNTFEVDPDHADDEREIKDRILHGILAQIKEKPNLFTPIRLKYVAAIAASIVFIFLGSLIHSALSRSENNKGHKIAASLIPPASQKALLIEPDGNTISLKSDAQSVIIKNNRITYSNGNDSLLLSKEAKLGDYAIQTPKGGYYTLSLSDGTRVWLNADSRLEYPLEFGQTNRVVTLTGEAYFEVSRDVKRPFYVKTRNQTVKVFGTEFNVSAYDDGKLTKTTLVSGKVSVFPSKSGNPRGYPLSPGHEATYDGSSMAITKVNASAATAWKSGLFYFNGTNAKDALQDLARWYDLSIVIEKGMSDVRFYGVIERNQPLQAIIDVLRETGVEFELTEKDSQKHLNVYQK